MDPSLTDTIDRHGDPLAFRLRQGRARSPLLGSGRDVALASEASGTSAFTRVFRRAMRDNFMSARAGHSPEAGSSARVIVVEARQLAGHQKEAVVSEGADRSAWRLTSDEGKHLRGSDLAPFPLGFFNAGLQSDLYGRLRALAAARKIALDAVEIGVANHYWLAGSFIHGTGEGHAEAPDIELRMRSSAATETTGHWSPRRSTHHPPLHSCARRSPATPSRSTSTGGGATSPASPVPRAPMPMTPTGSMRTRRAPSIPMHAATSLRRPARSSRVRPSRPRRPSPTG
jgi:hypothetical protein